MKLFDRELIPGESVLVTTIGKKILFLKESTRGALLCRYLEGPAQEAECYWFPREVAWPDEDFQKFSTGAVRDTQDGKSRPDFMDPRFILRYGEHMRKGGEKYGEFNFAKGIPSQRYMASLQRHLFSYYSGDRSEDHLSAIVFNTIGIALNENTELDDLYRWDGNDDSATD